MAQKAVTGAAARPMPIRVSAWAIYDVFETRDGQQIFVAVVSDALWVAFCKAFEIDALAADPVYRTNAQRVRAREQLLPRITALLRTFDRAELMTRLERARIPFAPINRPEDMFDDPHLLAGNGLGHVVLPNGVQTKLPNLPLEMGGRRPTRGGSLARSGEHTLTLLSDLGLSREQIEALATAGVVGLALPAGDATGAADTG